MKEQGDFIDRLNAAIEVQRPEIFETVLHNGAQRQAIKSTELRKAIFTEFYKPFRSQIVKEFLQRDIERLPFCQDFKVQSTIGELTFETLIANEGRTKLIGRVLTDIPGISKAKINLDKIQLTEASLYGADDQPIDGVTYFVDMKNMLCYTKSEDGNLIIEDMLTPVV